MIRALIVGLFLYGATAACSASFRVGGASKTQPESDDKNEVANKTPQDTGRPSEDSEGLPGYLTDPSVVFVQTQPNGAVVVGAPAGAVTTRGGVPDRVTVKSYVVDQERFYDSGKSADERSRLAAKLIAETRVTADGAFTATLDVADDEVLVLALDQQASATSLIVGDEPGATVYLNETRAFEVLTRETLDWPDKPESAVPGASEPCSAGGKPYADTCWYLSEGKSCTAACEGRGGYDEKTNTVAGKDGTLAACYAIVDMFGEFTRLGDTQNALGLGCAKSPSGVFRAVKVTTRANTQSDSNDRFCACHE